MSIILKSDTYQVVGINKKTSVKFFKNLKLGSLIKFEVELKRAGSGNHGTYATYIKATNLNTKETIDKSFNQMARILDNYELADGNRISLLPFQPTEKEMLDWTE